MFNMRGSKTRPATGTLVLLCAAVAMPVFIAAPSYGESDRHPRVFGHYYHGYRDYYYHGYRDYSGYLNPRSGHFDPQFQRNRENFGFSGRDPSYPGGEDPALHPPGLGH